MTDVVLVHSKEFGWHLLMLPDDGSEMLFYKAVNSTDNRLDFAEVWDTESQARKFAKKKGFRIV